MKSLKLALINISKNFKNEKELKTSFFIQVVGMAINNIALIVLWYYFGKTVGEINGWSPQDIFGMYAFNTISFGISHSFFAGLYVLPTYISSGNLDKYLITPKNILVKVSTSRFATSALGDLLFGVICFIVYIFACNLSIKQILLAFCLIGLATIIYLAFSIICATISFYLLDGQNVSDGLHEMFLSCSLYHGGAVTGILRAIFTFVIPSLLIGAIPVETVKNLSLSSILLMTGLVFGWFIISILFFRKSLKKYDSNNLFGFGG